MYYLLETDRVLIRPLEMADAGGLWQLFSRLEGELFRSPIEIHDVASAEQCIQISLEAMTNNQSVCWALIDKVSEQMIGLWHWTRTSETEASIYCCIAPENMRKGYMSEVATIMISQMPVYGLRRAIAEVPAQNLEARYFMLHFGWTCVEKGKDGYETWEFLSK
jgi:RimJ/RimL family protein N-acetyltransferase